MAEEARHVRVVSFKVWMGQEWEEIPADRVIAYRGEAVAVQEGPGRVMELHGVPYIVVTEEALVQPARGPLVSQ